MFLISCSSPETNEVTDEINAQKTNEEVQETAADEEQLRAYADLIVGASDNKDFEQLSTFVHPGKGVRFSPYVIIEEKEQQIFGAEQMCAFSYNDELYDWGTDDRTGNTIRLTPSEYYHDYLYIRDFKESDKIHVNDMEAGGNRRMNVEEVIQKRVLSAIMYLEQKGKWIRQILSLPLRK